MGLPISVNRIFSLGRTAEALPSIIGWGYGGVNIFTNFHNFLGPKKSRVPWHNHNRCKYGFCGNMSQDGAKVQYAGLNFDNFGEQGTGAPKLQNFFVNFSVKFCTPLRPRTKGGRNSLCTTAYTIGIP